MKKTGIIILVGLLATGCLAEMFAGTMAFKDGGTVAFVRLGNKTPYIYTLRGKLGAQRVEYKFSDLGQIIFSGGDFNSGKGEAVVVAKSGERFSLTECTMLGIFSGVSTSRMHYRYLDPVTHQEQNGMELPEKLASITIGKSSGTVKKNPATGEYFPSMYNFDPFTGESLEWAKRD